MSLEAPWMLAGLAFLVVPLWLHLRRRRITRIPFPAVSTLAAVAGRRRFRSRVEDLALLALRMLAVALLVMATARPGVAVRRPGGLRTGPALALVVVLDDTLSMRLEDSAGRTLFERARGLALREIDRLRPGDAAGLVLLGRPVRSPLPEMEYDLDAVRRLVEEARASHRSGDAEPALKAAARLLEDCPQPQREIVLVTDLAKSGWRTASPPWAGDLGPRLRVIDAGPDVPRDNLSVDSVETRPSPEGGHLEATIEARISNHGDRPANDLAVVLVMDGQDAARATVNVPARSTTTRTFHHRFSDEGVHRGLVRIARDRLPADNERHFSVLVRKSVSVLIVDGDFRPGSHRDEVFYLNRALATPVPGEAPISPVVIDGDTAAAAPLAGYDVVFLAGVRDLDPGLAERIVDFVRSGGGLFVSAPIAGTGLEALQAVLPGRIRALRESRGDRRPSRLAAANCAHPVFQPFGGGRTGLEEARVDAHLVMAPAEDAEPSTLLALEDNQPLLLERRAGAGAAMLLGTTVDREWTDLPIRPGFLPLVQRAARHLAGRLDEARGLRRYTVGAVVPMEVSRGMTKLVVRDPEAVSTIFSAGDIAGRSRIPFAGTLLPGAYRVWADIPAYGGNREVEGLEFVVETDPAESDLSRLDRVYGADTASPASASVRGQLPIWPTLLLAGLLALLAETALAGHALRRSHLKLPTGLA